MLRANTGEVVLQAREHFMLSGGGASWRADAELVVVDSRWNLILLDLEAGTSSVLGRTGGIPVAVSRDRLIRWGGMAAGSGLSLLTTDLDGGDQRQLLELPVDLPVRQVDLVPGVDIDSLAGATLEG